MSARLRRISSSPIRASAYQGPSARAVIDQATGVLILLYRVDAEQAFGILDAWARETGTTVLTVARTLVYAVCLEDDTRTWDRHVRDHVEAALPGLRPRAGR